MHFFRRFFSLFVLVAMMSAGTGLAQNAKMMPIVPAEEEDKTVFEDVVTMHPNLSAITYLKEQGVVKGYDNGTFLPDTTINRAEFMKIVIAATVKDPKGSNCFKDVKNEWFAKYICEAKTRGLVSGYPDGTFQPGLNINLVEASKIIANGFGLKLKEANTIPNGKIWYAPSVTAMETEKAIPVSIDYPEKKITRGEMSEMAWRIRADIEDRPTKTFDSLTSPLPTVASCPELKEKFALQGYRQNRYLPMLMRTNVGSFAEDSVESADAPVAAPVAAPAPASEKSEAGPDNDPKLESDYSSTNVQVTGVDEADIVKNDANYIYLIKGSSIRIVKAVPVGEMKEVARVTVAAKSFYPTEMYVTDNRLVVVGNSYDNGSKTGVHIFDITDRANVKPFRDFTFDGDYVSSRRIGNFAYFVMNNHPNYYEIMKSDTGASADASALVPMFLDSKAKDGKSMPIVPCGSIRIFPRYEEPNILVVAGVPLNDGEASTVRQAFLGSGSTIYSSLDSLYVSTVKRQYNDRVTYDIWMPPAAYESSVFYRFALKDGKVDYKTMGEVPGTLLNQFSMDESGEAFRVATTKGDFWNPDTPATNQLMILDKNNLSTLLGKVEDIGKGEKIKSVRFMGKRAYIVTFKNTDPFFVLDVADPRAPKILGELKLPGYSDYLHPYDENHIIGFGKDAVDASDFANLDDGFMPGRENFAWYQGMKLAMFDVTDATAPKEMFHEVIGDRGTQSELLYNHKALLFSKAKGLIAFPIEIAEIKDKAKAKIDPGTYGEVNFRGAVVYNVDLEKGFTLKGKVTHVDEGDFGSPYSGGFVPEPASDSLPPKPYFQNYDALIKRMLYIGNSLYSISMKKVEANSLMDMSKQGGVGLAKEPEQVSGVQ